MQGPKEQLLVEFSDLLKESGLEASIVSRRLAGLINRGLQIESIYDGNTTALHLACEYGNLHLVNALLRLPQAKSIMLVGDANDGDTAIHMAAIGGSFQVLRALFSALANDLVATEQEDGLEWNDSEMINIKNRWGQTPLHMAMGRGRVEAAKFLIDRGANVGGVDHVGSMPLHFAARSGVVACLELLQLDSNDLNTMVNKRGLTALHYAAWNGNTQVVDWLLQMGADLRCVDWVRNRTSLHFAARNGSFEVVDRLARAHHKAGIGILEEDNKGKNVLQLMERKGQHFILPLLKTLESLGLMESTLPNWALVRYVLAYGDEALHGTLVNCLAYVTRKWRAAVVSLFRDPSRHDGLTVLEWIATKDISFVSPVSVKLAKEYLTPEDSELQLASALRLALFRGNTRVASMLLEDSDDKFSTWIKGMRRLLINTEEALPKLQAILDELGDAALLKELAGDEDGEKDQLEKLLRDQLPFTYLVFLLGRQDIAKFIKDRNNWEGIANDKGHSRTRRTALHWATIFQQTKIVSQLCAISECRANLTDAFGKTAYQYAMENGRQDIQKELSERVDVRSHLEIMYRDRQVFVDAANAILVGAALIAGITFAGLLQPPLGYTFVLEQQQENSTSYVRMDKAGINVFWLFNSLAFFFAMATAIAGAKGVLPQPDMYIQEVVKSIRKTLLLASFLLAISISSTLLAFCAGGFSVVPPQWRFRKNMVSTVIAGSFVCILMLGWFIKGIYSLQFRNDKSSITPKDNDRNIVTSSRRQGRRLNKTPSVIDYEHKQYPWKDGLDEASSSSSPSVTRLRILPRLQ